MEKTAYLTLANGKVFRGKRFGAMDDVTGELVFTTAMTGYLETLTDPSYYGQMVVQTFPLIGNVGVISADFESAAPRLSAYIVREWCEEPSNFRCEGKLEALLEKHGVPGLYGLDTRELTRILREHGVMNARLSDAPLTPEEIASLASYRVGKIEPSPQTVSCSQAVRMRPEQARRRVVLWDFGAKKSIGDELMRRGCEVVQVPYGSTAQEILALKPDGIMLSNGPGDPADNTGVIAELAKLCTSGVPLFGICLGHQLLALARGARTEKLKYGHRGANQPVQEVPSGRVAITSQNHGYAVALDSLPQGARLRYKNGNDGTCEGLIYTDIPAFSVQFHPEASAGPLDTRVLFDEFVARMDAEKANRGEER